MDEWNKEFITGRGVALDAFLLDDGWDDLDRTLAIWPRHSATVLAKVREKADSIRSSVGLWLSPWDGYNKTARRSRLACKKRYWVSKTVDGKLALSGPKLF